MRRWITLLAAAALAGCVPAGGSGDQPAAPGGGAADAWPAASSQDILAFLTNGSAEVLYYDSDQLTAIECAFFAGDGSYEAFAYEAFPDGSYSHDTYTEFRGGWSVAGSELCIHGSYDFGQPGLGCTLAEWSSDGSLLLTDARDQVVAEVFAFEGPQEYRENGCRL